MLINRSGLGTLIVFTDIRQIRKSWEYYHNCILGFFYRVRLLARRQTWRVWECGLWFCCKVTAKGVYFMAFSASHVTATLSATWSPLATLAHVARRSARYFPPSLSFAICHCSSICSRTMLRLALLRHLNFPWAADVLLSWQTKEHDMRLIFAIILCVLQQTLFISWKFSERDLLCTG